MKKIVFFLLCLLILSPTYLSAVQHRIDPDEEDEEETATEPAESTSTSTSTSAVKGFAGGVKQVTYEGPKEFTKETVSQVDKKPPIVAMVEGVNNGTQKLLDNTVKGAYKVATLGKGDLKSYEIEEPKKGSDETTKIKISLPGT